ncbi:S8 family serine peptidase [Belliella pelovolcani]|uniref:Por secretion system C-terminal sorting domain-containing protein n=1 Tax=Belliella pelovolcani TaxID=529505 RepID=A0A1N7JMR1_9BACT|nr:S8 family serine peptidase [Belliella pelovolcani]SIS50526.1 Por secretion system C-terminal sorting domain-containing protein [Belliella pelovolcani]
MNKFVLLLVCYISVVFGNNLFSQDYYWSSDRKISIVKDTSILLIKFKEDHDYKSTWDFFKDNKTTHKNTLMEEKKIAIINIIDYDPSKLEEILNKSSSIEYYTPIFKSNNTPLYPTDKIILKPKSAGDFSEINRKFSNYFSSFYKNRYGVYIITLNNYSNLIPVSNEIYESNLTEYCHPNFIVELQHDNDPLYPEQYYLNNTGQFGGTVGIDINVLGAWNSIGTFSSECNINVAILDDGVENHEDFDGRVLVGRTIGNPTGFGAPGVGSAHGQACAGIVSATHNNELGIKGVAPNTNIIPVRILGVAADLIDIADAVDWAWDEGMADILSNSWGLGPGNCTLTGVDFNNIIDAYDRARDQGRGGLGSIVVFSSGNHGSCISFPRNINGAITVGAINNNGQIWNYSNTGPEMNLVAPSGDTDLNGNVRTTDRMGNNGYENGNYTNRFGGTSAAAPQVAGVAALMLSVNPNLTEIQVRTILQQTATDMGPAGFDNTFGYGRVNAEKAVKAALPTISGSDYLCSSSTYSIQNPSTGSTISWSVSPTHLFSGATSGSGATANLSPASGAASGQAILTFEVTTTCGVINVDCTIFGGDPFRIYPNPTTDYVTVSKVSHQKLGEEILRDQTSFEVSLFDVVGQEIISRTAATDEATLDLSKLKKGRYYIHIYYKEAIIRKQIKVE